MKNKDSKATQQGAWARHADISADTYIPFIMGQIDTLMGMLQSFHTSQTEYLASMKVLMERSVQHLDLDSGREKVLAARPVQDGPVPGKRRVVHISDLVL